MSVSRIIGWALVAGFVALAANNLVWVARHREIVEPVALGQAAPSFDLALLDAGRVHVGGAGPVTVIDFWASWCPPCRAELPVLDRLAKRVAPEGVRVLAVNVEEAEARDEVSSFVRGAGLTLPVALDGGPVSARYRVESLPTMAVLDGAGRIRKLFVGTADEADLVAAIEAARRAP